jgi:hypothetical protein
MSEMSITEMEAGIEEARATIEKKRYELEEMMNYEKEYKEND